MNLYDKYFDDLINLTPSMNDYLQIKKYKNLRIYYENNISKEFFIKIKDFLLKYKKILSKKGKKKIYDEVLKYEIDISLKGFKYPFELMPMTQMNNTISDYMQMLNGSSVYVFKTVDDYKDCMEKNKEYSIRCSQVIINFYEGMKKGIVLPKIIASKLINDIERVIKDKLYINNGVPKSIKEEWDNNVNIFVVEPSINILNFLKNIYIKKCRDTLGYSSLKNGKEMYKYLVKANTTISSLSIKNIHKLGWTEVKRINNELKKIALNNGYKNTTTLMKYIESSKDNKYKNKTEILKNYTDIRKYLWDNIIPTYFDIKINKPYKIVEVPSEIAGSMAGAYYMGGDVSGKRDGVFYLNTRDVKTMLKSDALTLSKHEGIPGHHFQITYMNTNKNIPMFIKASNYTGYIEGWALYSEGVGEYKDDIEYAGKLYSEMFRSVRLIVDTGIHYYNWTYDKCFDIFKKYTSLPNSEIESEIYRYVADPGQALAYKIGELTILNLKKKYNGDIKKFHRLILENGVLPLDILIQKFKKM
jgi:uncharacterized protein (DUF885 family)